METLIVEIVPDIYDWVSGYLVDCLAFFAAGILIDFLLWSIAFTVDSVFGWLRQAG